MKKLLFIAALAGAALVSCTKNEVAGGFDDEKITFTLPVTSPNTKATEILTPYPTSQKFSVFATYHTGNYDGYSADKLYMNEVEAAYSSDLVAWDPAKGASGISYYWPKQGTLTFAAYSPSSIAAVASYDAQGIHFTNYTVTSDRTKQIDVLFSERTYNQTKADMSDVVNPNYKGTEINFKHALSSIIFKVGSDKNYSVDNFGIDITKISLKGVNSVGTFNQTLADTDGAVTDAATFGWTDHTTPIEYVAYSGYQSLTTTMSYTNDITLNVGVNDKNNTNLILIPQDFTSATELYVEYNILNHNTGISIPQNATFKLNSYGSGWERGKRYIYNITVGLDKIYFNPLVEDWKDVSYSFPIK